MSETENTPDDALETVREVAQRLKMSERQVRRLIKSGQLPCYRICSTVRVSRADRLAFLAQRRSK